MEFKIESIIKNKNPELIKYIPRYTVDSMSIEINRFIYLYYRALLALFKFIIRLRLGVLNHRYRNYSSDASLTNEEIERIYTREAQTYEYKHHLTTNFRDTWWRRQVGLEIIDYARKNRKETERMMVLDVATGVGLSIEEMFHIFKLFDLDVDAIALDYNEKMLQHAREITLLRMKKNGLLQEGRRTVRFTRGDARNLVQRKDERMEYFGKNSFDCTTVMFGMGGVDLSLQSIKEQLMVLKLSGVFIMTDVHRPIVQLKEKWPWFIGKKNARIFAEVAWKKVTKPLVLATLWGWRDPTPTFYLASFIVYYDKEEDIYYGFRWTSFFLDNEFWWFGLPVMSTAKIVLKKIKISKEEFKERTRLLHELTQDKEWI